MSYNHGTFPHIFHKMFFHARYFKLLLAIALAARLAFMAAMPLTDPSESRYGVISANMARSGDFTVPRFIYRGEFQSFDGKPPLFFQIGGLACKVLGENEFAVRLPSLLAALGVLWLVHFTLRKLEGAEAALAGVVLCATGSVFYLFSGLCMTDMVLTFCTTGAVCAYMLFARADAVAQRRAKKSYSAAFFAFLGLGMLAKGPVAVVTSGLPVFAFVCAGRRWKELAQHAWVAGPALFLAIALPWYAAMTLRQPGFLEYFFINENFLRFTTPDYGDRFGTGHETFPGMALVWFAVANLPWLPLAYAVWRGRGRGGGAERQNRAAFRGSLPAWACVCITGFWCLTSRSLLQYLVPTAPLFAMWLAAEMKGCGKPGPMRFVKTVAPVSCAALIFIMSVAMWRNGRTGKFPKRMYAEVLRVRRENPEYAQTKFYFSQNAPFSAEFYVRDALRVHPGEQIEESLENSRDDFLFISKKRLEAIVKTGAAAPQREIVFENSGWYVFAPATKQ